jgi:hypothetical protein
MVIRKIVQEDCWEDGSYLGSIRIPENIVHR